MGRGKGKGVRDFRILSLNYQKGNKIVLISGLIFF